MTPTEWLASPAGRELRRSLPPATWLVLEELSHVADGTGVAWVSARGLAASLGLGKDTVAGALSRLCRRGVLARVGQQRVPAGRFGVGGYAVRVDAVSPSRCPAAPDTAVAASAPKGRRRAGTEAGDARQLSLLATFDANTPDAS